MNKSLTTAELTREELQFGIDNGILDADEIHSKFEMGKRQDTVNRFTEMFGYRPRQITLKNGKIKWWVELPSTDGKRGKDKKRYKPQRDTLTEIEDLIIEFMKCYDNNPTLHELFEKRLEYDIVVKGRRPSSRKRYREFYKRHFSEFGKKHIKNLTADDFVAFLEGEIANRKLKSNAFSDLKTVTRKILFQAKRDKLIDWDYESQVFRTIDVDDRSFENVFKEDYELVFDEDELKKITDYLIEHQDTRNLALLLQIVTGERVGENVAHKHEDIDPKNNTINVRRSETHYKDESGHDVYEIQDCPKTKSGYRTIVVPSSYRWLLEKLYFMSLSTEYVFEENGERLITDRVRKRLYLICKKVGVYKKSPHKLRATYDTILLDSGLDKRFVKDQMGHSNIKVTENNYHRNRKKIADKRQLLDSIAEFNAV